MVNGVITLTGTGRELLERPEVRAAYLEGGKDAALRRASAPSLLLDLSVEPIQCDSERIPYISKQGIYPLCS
jgi:hypothetical protein